MDELQNKVEVAFKDSSKQLKKLNDDLNKIADVQQEVTKLSDNLTLASNGLRKLSKDHSNYLQRLDELNSLLFDVGNTLGKIDPKKLNNRLEKIEQNTENLTNTIIRSEKSLRTSMIWTSFFMFIALIFTSMTAYYYAFSNA